MAIAQTSPGIDLQRRQDVQIDQIRSHLETMQVFPETAMRVVGDVYKPLTDAVAQAEAGLGQAEKSGDAAAIQAATARLAGARAALDAKAGERVLAHGLVGGLTAALGGVDPASGFLGGAAGKLATVELGQLIDGSDWARSNPVAAELLKTAIATSAGMVAGGATGGMVASQGDRFNRQLHQNEAIGRGGGAIKLASGSLGALGGLGMISGGVAGCGPSAGTSCLLVPMGGTFVAASYEEATDGAGQALVGYGSTEGSRVLASFGADTYPGERNRAAELGDRCRQGRRPLGAHRSLYRFGPPRPLGAMY